MEYDGNGSWSARDSVKWYDCDEEVTELSKFFPGILFSLSGIGEENDDQWTLYARDGKSYKEWIEIVYPAFEESKLQ